MNIKELQRLLKEDEEKSLIKQTSEYQDAIQQLRDRLKGRDENDKITVDDLFISLWLLFLDDRSLLLEAIKNEYREINTTLLQVCRRLNSNSAYPMSYDAFAIVAYDIAGHDLEWFMFRLLLNPRFDVNKFNSADIHKLDKLIFTMIDKKLDLKQLEQLEELFLSLNQQDQLNAQTLDTLDNLFRSHFAHCRHKKFTLDETQDSTKKLIAQLSELSEWMNKAKLPASFYYEEHVSKIFKNANKILDKIKEEFDATSTPELLHPHSLRIIFNRFLDNETRGAYGTFFTDSMLTSEFIIAIYKPLLEIIPNSINDQTFLAHLESFSQNLISKVYQDEKGRTTTLLGDANQIQKNMPSFVSSLKQANIFPAEKFWKKLLTHSRKRFLIFQEQILMLSAHSLLNQNSFDLAVSRLTDKLPSVTESTMQKKSRKETGSSRSEVTVKSTTDSNVHTFFSDHSKQHNSGNFGVVKKGYSNESDTTPMYAIKKLTNDDSGSRNLEKDAAREVKYHRLLQRDAEFIKKTKPYTAFYYVVTKWLPGQSLPDMPAANLTVSLTQLTYEQRLKCLCDGLSDLNTLHQHNRVHGDIKPGNFIVDFKLLTMKLIDFGGAIKVGSLKNPLSNYVYNIPSELFSGRIPSDVYAMGLVAATLFPELFKMEPIEGGVFNRLTFSLLKSVSEMTPVEKAIHQLVECMTNLDRTSRCSSEDAYQYCSKLVNDIHQLDDAKLQDMTAATIKHAQITVEDVLRGARV